MVHIVIRSIWFLRNSYGWSKWANYGHAQFKAYWHHLHQGVWWRCYRWFIRNVLPIETTKWITFYAFTKLFNFFTVWIPSISSQSMDTAEATDNMALLRTVYKKSFACQLNKMNQFLCIYQIIHFFHCMKITLLKISMCICTSPVKPVFCPKFC